MAMLESYLMVLNHTRTMTLKLIADLNDDQMCFQPAPKMNHPAWVMGHLIQVDYAFLNLITGAPLPAWIDDNWKATYGNKSDPVGDKSKYKPKLFYIDKAAEVRDQIVARLREMKPADFLAPHPDPARRERFPTVGHMVMFYGTWHETYHSGQLSAWRRVQGLPAV